MEGTPSGFFGVALLEPFGGVFAEFEIAFEEFFEVGGALFAGEQKRLEFDKDGFVFFAHFGDLCAQFEELVFTSPALLFGEFAETALDGLVLGGFFFEAFALERVVLFDFFDVFFEFFEALFELDGFLVFGDFVAVLAARTPKHPIQGVLGLGCGQACPK